MIGSWIRLVLFLTGVQCGKKLVVKGIPIIYIKKGAQLRIGSNVTIRSSFLSNLIGMYCRTIIVARIPGAVIEIGDHVGISGTTLYARKGIYIGDNTCIGANCKIMDNDFHPIDYETRNDQLMDSRGAERDVVPCEDVRIGKNCFIGCNVIILKGTVLGDGCVVGAGAVVSGEFEGSCVLAGNPARVIRKL